jgi:hypothetical protein
MKMKTFLKPSAATLAGLAMLATGHSLCTISTVRAPATSSPPLGHYSGFLSIASGYKYSRFGL